MRLISELRKKKLFLFDCDGVLWRGNTPIEGANSVLNYLTEHRINFGFITNNSTLSRNTHVQKFEKLGLPVPEENQIINSSFGAGRYLASLEEVTTVYAIGEAGLVDELSIAGLEVLDTKEVAGKNVDAVCVGMDRQLTYEKLTVGLQALLKGAIFVATNLDKTFPTEQGLIPGAGACIAALEASAGMTPVFVVGKPSTFLLEIALNQFRHEKEEVVFVGDRPSTDIACAQNADITSVLVQTGVKEPPSETIKPDIIIPSIAALLA